MSVTPFGLALLTMAVQTALRRHAPNYADREYLVGEIVEEFARIIRTFPEATAVQKGGGG